MMNKRKVLEIILWQGIEDNSGLWEILWEIHTKFPNSKESDCLSMAREAVKELLQDEKITLYLCQEPYGELTEISDWEEIVENVDSWKAPEKDQKSIRFGTTEKGKTYYESI